MSRFSGIETNRIVCTITSEREELWKKTDFVRLFKEIIAKTFYTFGEIFQ
jgi:hypothetical protein